MPRANDSAVMFMVESGAAKVDQSDVSSLDAPHVYPLKQ